LHGLGAAMILRLLNFISDFMSPLWFQANALLALGFVNTVQAGPAILGYLCYFSLNGRPCWLWGGIAHAASGLSSSD
jgi:hypothetical protein